MLSFELFLSHSHTVSQFLSFSLSLPPPLSLSLSGAIRVECIKSSLHESLKGSKSSIYEGSFLMIIATISSSLSSFCFLSWKNQKVELPQQIDKWEKVCFEKSFQHFCIFLTLLLFFTTSHSVFSRNLFETQSFGT